MKRKKLLIALGSIVIVAIVVVTPIVLHTRADDKRNSAVRPLVAVASTLVPPAGARVAMQDTSTESPPTAVRGWRSEGTIDEACAKWRDAFRTWIGPGNLGSVQGEVVQGQSCSLEAKKDGYRARLSVALYGSEPPQATLTVTQ